MIECLDFVNIYIMGGIEMFTGFYFFTGFLQKKVKFIYHILFAVLGTTILAIFKLEGIFGLLVFILMLMVVGKVLCKVNYIPVVLYAVVTTEIMNLCFGISNSLGYIVFPIVFNSNSLVLGFALMGGGSCLATVLSVVCYRVIQQCCVWNEPSDRKNVLMILMPTLLIFLVSEYINANVYGNTVTTGENGRLDSVNPYPMLLMQTLGIASLFCIMFAYKKLVESFKLNKEVALLEIQAHSLSQYVSEAKLRYEKTKSFRHDIKNHITVVKELLQNKKTEAALQYIEGMQNGAEDISFPVSTNHPVLDILLGNKLGIAKDRQIEVQCSVFVPYPCGIGDMDFCIILGNALDNAISACNQICKEKQKYIHVTGKVQGDFLLIEIENSYIGKKSIRSGTGIANIRAVAEKYHGAMEIRTEGEVFVLSVLLIIPQQPECILQQSGKI